MPVAVTYLLTVNAEMVPVELIPTLINALADLEPVLLDKVGTYLYKVEEQNFEDRGATFGVPWEPLKPETRLEKARLGYGDQDLVRTGKLAAAIGESITLAPDSISVGIDPAAVPYAADQNDHRLLIAIGPQQLADIEQMLEQWAASLGIPPGAVQFTPV